MKKLVLFFVALLCGTVFLSGCSETKDLVFIAPDGGTLLPPAQLFCDAPVVQGYRIKGEAVSGTAVEARLFNETCDAAIAPINLCAKVYNTNKSYVLAGVIAWGNNYIISTSGETPESLTDLYGEVIYAFGGAAVPGVTLKTVLTDNEIAFSEITAPEEATADDKVYLLFLADPASVLAQVNRPGSTVKYAYLPEPTVTAITSAGVRKVAFDVQALWAEQNDGQRYPQAGLMIRKALLTSNPEAAAAFLEKMEESAAFCLANPQETARLAKEELQSAALPEIAMTQKYIEGNGKTIMKYGSTKDETVKTEVVAYLKVIMGAEPAAEFFY